jgi:hypothetical protein
MGLKWRGLETQLTVRLLRHSQRKRGATDRLNLRSMALALDPTTLREPKALTIQPTRYRSHKNMGEILSKGPATKQVPSHSL